MVLVFDWKKRTSFYLPNRTGHRNGGFIFRIKISLAQGTIIYLGVNGNSHVEKFDFF